MDSQLFTFIFAFVLFLLGVCVMMYTGGVGVKRMEELDKRG